MDTAKTEPGFHFCWATHDLVSLSFTIDISLEIKLLSFLAGALWLSKSQQG